jgi:hypothetical protein
MLEQAKAIVKVKEAIMDFKPFIEAGKLVVEGDPDKGIAPVPIHRWKKKDVLDAIKW